MNSIKEMLSVFSKTLTLKDSTAYGVAGFLLVVGKIATGILPIIAVLIGIIQLRIQYVQFKTKKVELAMMENEKNNKQEEHILKMSVRKDG